MKLQKASLLKLKIIIIIVICCKIIHVNYVHHKRACAKKLCRILKLMPEFITTVPNLYKKFQVDSTLFG